MANINLLPEEIRKRIKTERKTTTYKIELTSPPKEKGGETVKEGGALSFFKTAFRKPVLKPKTEEEAKEPEIRIMPEMEKKRVLKPELVFARPEKVPGPGIWTKFINWLKRLFTPRPKIITPLPPKKVELRPVQLTKEEEKFPKIKPKEFLAPELELKKEITKPRPEPVFREIILEEIKPKEEEILIVPPELPAKQPKPTPLIPKPTLGERLSFWFRNLLNKISSMFKRKKREKVELPKPKPIITREVMPEMKKVQPKATEILYPELKIEEEKPLVKEFARPAPPPPPPMPKPTPLPPPPPKEEFFKVKPEPVLREIVLEEIKPKEEKPLAKLPELPPKPPVQLPKLPVVPKQSLWSRLSLWFKNLINRIRSSFKRNKKEKVSFLESKPITFKEVLPEVKKKVQLGSTSFMPKPEFKEEKPMAKEPIKPLPPPPPPSKEEFFKVKPEPVLREIVLEEIKPKEEKPLAKLPELPPKPPVQLPKLPVVPKQSLWSRLSLWLKNLLNKISSLFRKKERVSFLEEKPVTFKEILPEVKKEVETKITPPFLFKPEVTEVERPLVKELVKPVPPPPPPMPKPTPPPPTPTILKEAIRQPETEKPQEKGWDMTKPHEISPEVKRTQLFVNLVPEEIREKLIPKSRLAILFVVVLAAIVMTGLIYIGLKIYLSETEVKIKTIEQQISDFDTRILRYKGFQEELIGLSDKTANVKKLLDRHIYWTNFLSYLEKYTIPEVSYTNMAADIGGVINLTAVGTDYESAARQLLVLKNASDFVNNVSISSVSATTSTSVAPTVGITGTGLMKAQVTGVQFSIALTVKPEIFYKRVSQ